MRLLIIAISMVVALAGCASVTDPVKIGDNLFIVNSQASGTFYSWGETKNMALVKANEYCDKQEKSMSLEGEDYSGAKSFVPIEAHIKFRCNPR